MHPMDQSVFFFFFFFCRFNDSVVNDSSVTWKSALDAKNNLVGVVIVSVLLGDN